jgi:alkanesulfonate monooxygenase SsuD/methylene tetrahydromethanopterin reductase-like flavin-dependent oxidoreductase (luciferase family)
MPAPFPALVSAAEATTRLRVGTLVLNVGFYQPALLARVAAEVHELTGGRFELGLGAGWAAQEFEAAEMLGEAGHRTPLLVGGQGERVLTLAARHADIVNISDASGAIGLRRTNPLAERSGSTSCAGRPVTGSPSSNCAWSSSMCTSQGPASWT